MPEEARHERDDEASTEPTGDGTDRRQLGGEGGLGPAGPGAGEGPAGGEASQLPLEERDPLPDVLNAPQSPLFSAQHAGRYDRQEIIRAYEQRFDCRLVVMIDAIFDHGPTMVEELLYDADPSQDLHLMLASPGGDGEIAVRMVRILQARCRELTVVVPDMAKSAATILALGADHILMGPGSDLGPVDPQFQLGNGLVGAKEIIGAVESAEERIKQTPDAFPLYASLLSDVSGLMVEQARSALERSRDLVLSALTCSSVRTPQESLDLAESLVEPLITQPTSHGATFGPKDARAVGLPVIDADLSSVQWRLLWRLWTQYFHLGCYPVGPRSVYEGGRSSQVH